jgi:glycerol-3-phosphate acyltransferase PlsY
MVLLIVTVAYLIGAIPSGYLIARLYGIKDIRLHGSGNIGATNVGRILGAPFFFLVFFVDYIKAFALVWSIKVFSCASLSIVIAAGLALIIGNGASVFLKFRGGKAVSTTCGVLAAIDFKLVLVVFIPWFLTLFFTRRVGIASVIAYVALPLCAILTQASADLIVATLSIAVWGIFLHRSNIKEFLLLKK